MRNAHHIRNKKNQLCYWKFVYNIIFMLSECNISQKWRNLLWKKCYAWKLPSKHNLQCQLPQVAQLVENTMKCKLRYKILWIVVDETTDTKNKKVENVVLRILELNRPALPNSIASKIIIYQLVYGQYFINSLQGL